MEVPHDAAGCRGPQGGGGPPERARWAIQDRRRPARDARGALAAQDLARRAAAAVQRDPRRDVPGWAAAAGGGRGRARDRLGPSPPAPDPRYDWPLADPRR